MRRALLTATALIAGCGDGLSPREEAQRDARDIARVEQVNRGPVIPIVPEPILYPDIEKNDLYGTSCAFVAQGGGLGAVALAMRERGYMKLDGKLVRFSADSGSAELPFGARHKYDGKKFAFEIQLADQEGRQSGAEAVNYTGRLTVRDERGNIVYDKAGEVQCGS